MSDALAQDYGDLFRQPGTQQRQALYSLAYDLPIILRQPPNQPWADLPDWHPVRRLGTLVRSHQVGARIRWVP